MGPVAAQRIRMSLKLSVRASNGISRYFVLTRMIIFQALCILCIIVIFLQNFERLDFWVTSPACPFVLIIQSGGPCFRGFDNHWNLSEADTIILLGSSIHHGNMDRYSKHHLGSQIVVKSNVFFHVSYLVCI